MYSVKKNKEIDLNTDNKKYFIIIYIIIKYIKLDI